MSLRPESGDAPARDGAVLVLGASRGLGRAIAIAAAESGFPVILGCRDSADGEEITRQIGAFGGRALAVRVDVTDYASVLASVDAAEGFAGGLAGLVNNAATIAPLSRLELADPMEWAQAMQVNIVGPFNGIRAALPRLPTGGVIINLSSGAAHLPVEGWSAYCASKAALVMLTRSTFAESGDRIRIYGAQPGMVDTDMQAQIRASGIGAPSRFPRHGLSPAGMPARAIAWLLRHAPQDLSGSEVDLGAVDLRLRMGRSPQSLTV